IGLLVGLPTWYVAGYRVALLIAKRYPNTPVPQLLGKPRDVPENERPSFFAILSVLLLPLVLIFFNTGLNTLVETGTIGEDNVAFELSQLIGNTQIALLLSALLAMLVLYVVPRRRRGEKVGGLLE